MIWTAGCEKAGCECMDEAGHGAECPQAPEFSDEDQSHEDHLDHRPRRLFGDERRPEHRHPPSHWGGDDIHDRHYSLPSEL